MIHPLEPTLSLGIDLPAFRFMPVLTTYLKNYTFLPIQLASLIAGTAAYYLLLSEPLDQRRRSREPYHSPEVEDLNSQRQQSYPAARRKAGNK